MKKFPTFLALAVLALAAMALAACSSPIVPARAVADSPTTVAATPTAAATPKIETFSDPFAYCSAVGTIDLPGASYTGPQMTEGIIAGFKKAAGLEASTEPMDMFMKTTIWRCMDSQVYACNFGANLPCSSKANTDKTPTQAMKDFCQASPNSDFIPMAVTGHSTIYSWHCVNDTPELLDQIETVDAAGYLAGIWYPIEPNVPAGDVPTLPPSPTVNAEPTAGDAPTTSLQPLTMEVCDGEAQAMAHALNVLEVTQSEEPLVDPMNGLIGTGCESRVRGTGVQFSSPNAVVKSLGRMLKEEGWTEDPMMAASGPTGIGVGYRKGSQICMATARWEPDASANCSKAEPISACAVTPEQKLYTVALNFGEVVTK